MRIALISRRFDSIGGGTERDLLITAQILAEAGHQVTVYANEVRSQQRDLMVRRINAPPLGRAVTLLSFGFRAVSLARRDGAELVVSFARAAYPDIVRSGGGAHVSYLRAARRWQSPARWAAMRINPYHRAQIALERASFKSPWFRCAIAVSEFVRRDLLKNFALNPSQVVTLYNGVDLKRFAPNSDKSFAERIRRQLGIPEDSPTVAFIGHGFARKGLKFLLSAWPLIDQRARLIVVGNDRTGAYRRLANRLGVGDRVAFLGARADIGSLFAAVDGLALPSLFEPFGNVVMEAMAAGVPALCSRQTGAAELIPPELNELIVADPTNPKELAQRLDSLLKLSGDASKLARATAEQYSWDRYGTELLRTISNAGRKADSSLPARPTSLSDVSRNMK